MKKQQKIIMKNRERKKTVVVRLPTEHKLNRVGNTVNERSITALANRLGSFFVLLCASAKEYSKITKLNERMKWNMNKL